MIGPRKSSLVSELGGSGLALSTQMNGFVSIGRAYEMLVAVANYLQAPLFFLRVYFFWQLFLAGKGKLLNIDKTAEFFGSLNIPLPVFSAYLAGATECFGGLLLVVGLAVALGGDSGGLHDDRGLRDRGL